jgi:hypothetical protein
MQETRRKIRVDICVHLRYLNIIPMGGYPVSVIGYWFKGIDIRLYEPTVFNRFWANPSNSDMLSNFISLQLKTSY